MAVPRVQAPSPKSVAEVTHLVPDFRGETLTSAQGIAAEASIVLELHGDARGLVVEQRPHPGTVVTGDSPRVRLRFTLDSPHREEG